MRLQTGCREQGAPASISVDACWKRIGTWSSEGSSCPKLQTAVHCRNCSTYIDAGRQLLAQQALPDERERRELGHYYNQIRVGTATDVRKATIFRIGVEWLALDAGKIIGVLEPRPLCPLPHHNAGCVRGIANIDGDTLVVLSLHQLLGIKSGAETAVTGQPKIDSGDHRRIYPRMIKLGTTGLPVIVSVDEIYGRITYTEEEIRPTPDTVGKAMGTFTRGLIEKEQKIIGILDSDLFFCGLEQAIKGRGQVKS